MFSGCYCEGVGYTAVLRYTIRLAWVHPGLLPRSALSGLRGRGIVRVQGKIGCSVIGGCLPFINKAGGVAVVRAFGACEMNK
mgnify:CR=1 FL=1